MTTEISLLCDLFGKQDLARVFQKFKQYQTMRIHNDAQSNFVKEVSEICQQSPFINNQSNAADNNCSSTLIFGSYRNQKLSDYISLVIQGQQQKTISVYIFLGLLFEIFLSKLLIQSKWRHSVTALVQIPSTMYQIFRSEDIDISRIFPNLCENNEKTRALIYPSILERVVCVLKVLDFNGKSNEAQEKEKFQYDQETLTLTMDDDDDEDTTSQIASDISVLEETMEENGGTLTLLSKAKASIMIKHPLFDVLLECEYDSYTISAVLFTFALEEAESKKDDRPQSILSVYQRLQKELMMPIDELTTCQNVCILSYLLTRNVSVWQHFPVDQVERVLNILEFFKPMKKMMEFELINQKKIRRGMFLTFDIGIDNDKERAKKYNLLEFRMSLVDPLSIQTSMTILKERFGVEESDFMIKPNYDTQKTLLWVSKKFHRDLVQSYIPYLTTCPSFIERPGSPGMAYPLHTYNYFYGGPKGLLFSMKAMLRLFSRTYYFSSSKKTSFLPTENAPELQFFSYFYLIIDRFMYINPKREWSTVTLFSSLDEAFNNPMNLEYDKRGVEQTWVTDKEGKEVLKETPVNLSNGLKKDLPNIYAGIRSFCYMNALHEIQTDIVQRLFDVFSASLQLKVNWELLWKLIIHLMDHIQNSRFEHLQFVNIPSDFYPKELFPFPSYLIFYIFIASETKLIDHELAYQIFTRIHAKHPSRKRSSIRLSQPHPGVDTVINVPTALARYKDFFNTFTRQYQFKNEIKVTQDDKTKMGYIALMEYLEQNSYLESHNTFEELIEQNVVNASPLSADHQPFSSVRWCPLRYDAVVNQKELPYLPLYFSNVDERPITAHDCFPMWKSEFRSSNGNKRKRNAKETPLSGCHSNLITFIQLYPFKTDILECAQLEKQTV